MIIRQELNAPQPGIFMGFDQLGELGRGLNTDVSGMGDDISKVDNKKRWSLLNKVLSFGGAAGNGQNPNAAWDDEFTAARRETAESRSRTGNGLPSSRSTLFNKDRSSDDDSRCSSPTFEDQKSVFKFILAWQHQAAPPRDRILTRPRLPTPAQNRITSITRGASPVPPATSSSPPTRKFSGNQAHGLINSAKNASLISSPTTGKPQLSLKLDQSLNWDSDLNFSSSELDQASLSPVEAKSSPAPSSPAGEYSQYTDRFGDAIVHPVKPKGIYIKNAVYTGRSLAEWGQVVWECNNFVERRRDEGISDLFNIEIPILGVEGFRKFGG